MKREELIARLRSSAAIMGMLPENPGYNGSVLLIDDTEAARVAKDLDDAVAALTALQSAEHLAPEDDAKAKRRCKCEFSSGGVWAKKCAFHAALQSREAVVRECVKKYLLDQVAHVEDNANKLATFAGEENEARCRKLAGSYLRELAQCVDLDAILKLLEKP